MKPETYTPLYGRLVHLPIDERPDPKEQRYAWLMPLILAFTTVALTLLLAS